MDAVLFNTHDVMLLCTMLLCVICTALLLQLPQPNRFHKLFIVGFFLASLSIPLDILINFGAGFHPWMVKNYLSLIYLFEFGAWLQAPMAYWLIKSQVDKNFRFSLVDGLLLLPLLLNTAHQLIAYHSLPIEVKQSIQNTLNIMDLSVTLFFVQTAREIFRVALAIASISLVERYFRNTEAQVSRFSWLHALSYGLFIYTCISLSTATLLTAQVLTKTSLPIGSIGLAQNYLSLLYFVALATIVHRDSVEQHLLKAINLKNTSTKPGFNFAHIEALEPLMINNKIYTNPELSLEELAHNIGVSPRTLSGVINGHYGCSFFEFINGYRVQEAKRLLAENSKQSVSVLDIMYESGFNSKATFNGIFKKTEGMTPSQYRKSVGLHRAVTFGQRH